MSRCKGSSYKIKINQLSDPEFAEAMDALSMELVFPDPNRPLPQNVREVLLSGDALAIEMATRAAEGVINDIEQVGQDLKQALGGVNEMFKPC